MGRGRNSGALGGLLAGMLLVTPLTLHAAPELALEETDAAPIAAEFSGEAFSGMNITCFDVNDKGEILLFLDTDSKYFMSTRGFANIYAADGTFLYSMTWDSPTGGYMCAWWDGEDPVIYDLRSDLVSVTGYRSGKPRVYRETQYQQEQIDAYEKTSLRTVNGIRYKSNLLALTVTQPDGTQTEVYRNRSALPRAATRLAAVLVLAGLVILAIIKLPAERASQESEPNSTG